MRACSTVVSGPASCRGHDKDQRLGEARAKSCAQVIDSEHESSLSDLAQPWDWVEIDALIRPLLERALSNFRPIDRDTDFLMPPSVDEWLPERHLARFVVEVIAGLDLRAMIGSYRGSGQASYHPTMLLGLLVYGYATGVFSSRKLERATYDSVAFRFIAANDHPDHDTIAAFRRRFLKQIETLFVQVLCWPARWAC